VRSAIALVVVLAGLAGVAPAARAGTYDVWSCQLPTGRPAPIAGWSGVASAAPPPSDHCATFQGMRAEFPGWTLPASAHVGWQFDAPPNTTIAGYELHRSARVGVGADGTSRSFALYHDLPRWEPTVYLIEFCTSVIQGCLVVGDPMSPDPMDPDNRVTRTGLGIRRLILRMECRGPNGPRDCSPTDPGGALTIGRARISLSDGAAPVLAPPSGSLLTTGAVLDGAQGVTASATDSGGGVARFAVAVDGNDVGYAPVDDQHPACRVPYVDLVPCPATVTKSFAFDTTAVANGAHAVQIVAIDSAGNRTASSPVNVWIANGAAPNGEGASRRARLVASFKSRQRRTGRTRATVPFGTSRAIRGRLTDARGAPIAGARIDVMVKHRIPGASVEHEGFATTRADGRFRYVPRRGASRRLQLAYRAFSLDPEPSATVALTLDVRAGVTLDVRPRRTSSRGTIRFRGRLLGGPARSGVQVALYAVGRRGRSRVPVAVLKTGASGRFRFRYQFLRTFAPFTYRFVAQVERQRGYPYAAAPSRTVTVRVVR
jgi:hypothetical protein